MLLIKVFDADHGGITTALFMGPRGSRCRCTITPLEQTYVLELVYATEGTPLITTPAGIFRSAPNPNAARLFQNFLCGAQGQQVFIGGNRHSFHALAKPKPGRTPLSAVKLMTSDPAAVEAKSEEIKARYAKLFGV